MGPEETATERLSNIWGTIREAREQTFRQFYGNSSYGYRAEKPYAINPRTGKPYGSVVHRRMAEILKREGVTFCIAETGATCMADLERDIDCLQSVTDETKAHMKASMRGLWRHGYKVWARDRGAA